MAVKDVSAHYDRVTDAWKTYMGDNLHFGYFKPGGTNLTRATYRLIDEMLALCSVDGKSRILDAGCGIGGPAYYIHKKFGCDITGISTSERGIHLARDFIAGKGCSGRVSFEMADAQKNGLPDKTFDIVWVMESSHLMSDKKALFRECLRVLKKGGTMVLCDIVLFQILPLHREIGHYLLNGGKYLGLIRAFGNARVNSPGTYCNGLREAGFREITVRDITAETMPTLQCWKRNAEESDITGTGRFTKKEARSFIRGCEILEEFFKKGILGYTLFRAKK